MSDQKPHDDVENLLSDEKQIAERKQRLIAELLQQRTEAIKSFDEKLALLGWRAPDAAKGRRSHHRRPETKAPAGTAPPAPATKAASKN